MRGHTWALADLDAFARAAELQPSIAGARLGFFGVIDERLDLRLVAELADANEAWEVVMVGPVVTIDPSTLPKRANIRWLGQEDYAVLPQLVATWSVCLMPFALNESTRFISPTKTLEYMAGGKPVVSTAIHDVVNMFGEVLKSPPTPLTLSKHVVVCSAKTTFRHSNDSAPRPLSSSSIPGIKQQQQSFGSWKLSCAAPSPATQSSCSAREPSRALMTRARSAIG